MSIPVRNVYYLLCYAWDRLEARNLVDLDAIPNDRAENLLALVLRDGVAHLIRRGLDRGYVGFEEHARRLRGKLLLTETIVRTLLPRGRAACEVDELSYDVPHNRVIKAAMRALMGVPTLDAKLRNHLRNHCQRLGAVSDVPLTAEAFRSVQLHRNVARYAFLINICRLVARSFLPDERTGERRFHPFTASKQEMGLLFEAFVRNFLRREQNVFHVANPKVPWAVDPVALSDPAWLPEMRTDITLTNASHRIVIEAKYSAEPFQSRYGENKLRSGHLYQLMTYLSQLRSTPGPLPAGVLLYAGSDGQNLDYRISGHSVSVRRLDLGQEWTGIRDELAGLARELAVGVGG